MIKHHFASTANYYSMQVLTKNSKVMYCHMYSYLSTSVIEIYQMILGTRRREKDVNHGSLLLQGGRKGVKHLPILLICDAISSYNMLKLVIIVDDVEM